jgi:hypothetical protein
VSAITFLIVFGLCFCQVTIFAIGLVVGWHFHRRRESFEKFEIHLSSVRVKDVIGKHKAEVVSES